MKKAKYAVEIGSNNTETRKPWTYYTLKEAKDAAVEMLKNISGEGNAWAGVWKLNDDGIMIDREKLDGYVYITHMTRTK